MTGIDLLLPLQDRIIEPADFTYSPWGIKGKIIEEH